MLQVELHWEVANVVEFVEEVGGVLNPLDQTGVMKFDLFNFCFSTYICFGTSLNFSLFLSTYRVTYISFSII